MSEILHKNAVITGCVNSFCLVCDSYLEAKEEAHTHVKTSAHCQNLGLHPYLDKFKDHNIRKVKAGYFCEFCNVLLLTAMKVEFHIIEENHIQKRGAMLLKSSKNGVIAFNNVNVSERSWHSMMNDVCSLCDIEVDDENLHKKNVSHILNLIQKPIKFDANEGMYRQIDDATIQCLTCNVLLGFKTISEHFTDVNHLDRYVDCKIKANSATDDDCAKYSMIKIKVVPNNDADKIPNNSKHNSDIKDDKRKISKSAEIAISKDDTSKMSKVDKINISKDVNISKILSSVSTYRSNDIDVNFETDAVFCRKCCVALQFDYDDIEQHIKEHSKTRRAKSVERYPTDVDKNAYCPKPNANEILNIADEETARKISIANGQNDDKSDSDEDCASVKSSSSAKMDDINLETNYEKCNLDEAKLFANENNLTYNENNGNAFCRICQVRLPSSLKSMKEHVHGALHAKKAMASKSETKNKSEDRKNTNALKTQNMKRFVYSVESLLKLYPEDCLINRKYCINQLSFYLIIENSRGLRCLLCEKNISYTPPFYKFEVQAHVDHSSHHSRMEVMPVITSVPSEFIREIRPGSFHCGFCNLILSSWSEMENHLNCADHINNKAIQNARLHREIGVRIASPFSRRFI